MARDWECADDFNTSLCVIFCVMTRARMFVKLPVTKAIKTVFWLAIYFGFCAAFQYMVLLSSYVRGGVNPSLRVVSFTYCMSLDGYKGI